VSHHGLALVNILKYLKAKEELWKLKYLTIQKYNLQKILKKKPKSFKILKLYNKSHVSTQAKMSSFKNTDIKIDLLLLLLLVVVVLLPRGQNPLSYYILYNESKHNNILLAFVGKAKKEEGVKRFITFIK
jgi:hypothetical protein